MFINVCSELKKVNKCIVFLINVIQIVLISDIKYIMCNGHTNIMSSICGNEGQINGLERLYNLSNVDTSKKDTPPTTSHLNPYTQPVTHLVKPSSSDNEKPYLFDSGFLINLNRL